MSKTKLMLVMAVMFSLAFLVSASDIDLNYPADTESCISGTTVYYQYTPNEASITTCFFYSNVSGAWVNSKVDYSPDITEINYFNDSSVKPGIILWAVSCSNDSNTYFNSSNYTYTLTDAPYCAYLTSTSCPNEINLNSEGLVKTRLGNTKGFWLENQDCNVWVENSSGTIVKKWNTMLVSAETSIMLDSSGNYINTAAKSDVVLTDSQGWYIYPIKVDGSWAWYGQEYTINVVCNGQKATCKFNATKERLPDMAYYEAVGKESAGVFFIGFIILIVLATGINSVWRRLRK